MTKPLAYSRLETDQELRDRLVASGRMSASIFPSSTELDGIADMCRMQRKFVWIES